MKYTIVMILLQVVSYNVLALYWSYQDNLPFCVDHQPKQIPNGTIDHCTGFFVSIARLEYEVTPSEQIIRVLSFVIQLLALVYIRDKLTKANAYYDEITTSMSDYSIIIKDIPVVAGVQAKVRRMLETFFSVPFKIEELLVIGHLKEFYELEHEKQRLIAKKIGEMGKKEPSEEELHSLSV
jgi:hypothetical protein